MPHTLALARAATDVARDRRVRLSTRALLALALQLTAWLEQAAHRVRRRLDPRGGAEDPLLA